MCEKEIVMKAGAVSEIEWEFSVPVNTHYGAHTHTYTLKTATFPFPCFYLSTKCTNEHSFYVNMYCVCVFKYTNCSVSCSE